MKKPKKIIALVKIALLIAGCGSVKPEADAHELVGLNYQRVIDILQNNGFENIKIEELNDLTSNSEYENGEVDSISIGDNGAFTTNDAYAKNTEIVISYHSYKRIPFPIELTEIDSLSSQELEDRFYEYGYESVTSEEIDDVDSYNEILIDDLVIDKNYDDVEKLEQGFPFNSEVHILHHAVTNKESGAEQFEIDFETDDSLSDEESSNQISDEIQYFTYSMDDVGKFINNYNEIARHPIDITQIDPIEINPTVQVEGAYIYMTPSNDDGIVVEITGNLNDSLYYEVFSDSYKALSSIATDEDINNYYNDIINTTAPYNYKTLHGVTGVKTHFYKNYGYTGIMLQKQNYKD